jgi:hypothetical protein
MMHEFRQKLIERKANYSLYVSGGNSRFAHLPHGEIMKQTILLLVIITLSLFSQNAPAVKTIHFKELQKCLPVKAPEGFVKEKPKGQTMSSSGISSSNASIEFTAPKKEKRLQTSDEGKQDSVDTDVTWTASIEIVDFAGMGEGMAATLQMVAGMQFENESDGGYEKSVTFNGYKGIEKSNVQDESRTCSLQLVVGDRFIVTANGNGFSDVSILQELISATDLKKLAALK